MNPSVINHWKKLEYFLVFFCVVLCSWNYGGWSITNDELSALNRLNFGSISELISQGILIDGHPALTQLFLYFYTELFGVTTWAIRIPFVIAALVGLLFMYKATSQIISKTAAFLSVLALVQSQFFLNYSQLARPYALGFMACMLLFYRISKLSKEGLKPSNQIIFILGIVLSFTSHYFAALSGFLLILFGFGITPKQNRKRYLILSFIAAIILLVHLPITLNHLSIGGLSWLPKPENDFFIEFLYYAFNQNWLFLFCILLVLVLAYFLKYFQIRSIQLPLLTLAILPYLVAYFYSKYQSPVLQNSALLFSFPFLLIFLFSFLKEFPLKGKYMIVVGFILIGISTLWQANHFFSKRPFANFKEVVSFSLKETKKYGKQDLLSFANTNDSSYFYYYYQQFCDTVEFDIPQFYGNQEIIKAFKLIDEGKQAAILFSFAGVPIPLEVYEYAKLKYPTIEERQRYFNSEVMLLSNKIIARKKVFTANFETPNPNWEVAANSWNDSIYYSSPKAYQLTKETEYAATFRAPLKNLSSKNHPWLTVSMKLKHANIQNLLVVFDVRRKGESIYWRGYDTQVFYKENEWYTFLSVWQRTEDLEDDDELLIYLWNKDQGQFYIDDLEINNYEDSDYFFYED